MHITTTPTAQRENEKDDPDPQGMLRDNRDAILAGLKAANIETLAMRFDGSCDEGALEDFEEDVASQIDTINVTCWTRDRLAYYHWGPKLLLDAIDNLCWDILPIGWQDNEGAEGEIVFNTSNCSVTVNIDRRYYAFNSDSFEV